MAENPQIRPDRILTRLKINSVDDSQPRVVVTRQPKGPDGIGFNARLPRLVGKFRKYFTCIPAVPLPTQIFKSTYFSYNLFFFRHRGGIVEKQY